MGWKDFKSGRLVCPLCAYDGSTPPEQFQTYDSAPFHWLEDTVVRWDVAGVRGEAKKGGMIQIEDGCRMTESYWNPRIQCASCGGEFPVPEGASYEFIDICEVDWTPVPAGR